MWPTASNASRTTSYGPTDTPPETTTMSASAIPRRSRASTSSSRSAAIPSSSGHRPGLADQRPDPRAVRVRDARRPEVGRRPHAPRRPSRGPRRSGGGGPTISARPAPDARATDRRRHRRRPARSDRRARLDVAAAPCGRVAGRDRLVDEARGGDRAGRVSARAARRCPSASSGVVISTGTTASAPAGIGAPVAIRTAVSGSTRASGARPGARLRRRPSAAPAGPRRPPATSAARTA